MTVEALLARLDGVRRTGDGRWVARCPGHDDRRASLSIRELDDGRVLVHDFAGCGVETVLAAVGLHFDVLFPERAIDHHLGRQRHLVPIRDLITALEHELTVALIVLSDVSAGSAVDTARAALARTRIADFLHELRHA